MTVETTLPHGLKTSLFGSQWNIEYGDNLALLDPDRITSGLLAARPAAGVAKRFYYATDQNRLYYDNGAVWAEQSVVAPAHAASHEAGGGDIITVAQSQVTNLTTDLAAKAAAAHLHTGVYEPANANVQAHIGSTANPHNVTAAQTGAASAAHTHSQSDVTNLASDLASKANDAAVMHLAGNETTAGVKTFSAAPILSSLTGIVKANGAGALTASAYPAFRADTPATTSVSSTVQTVLDFTNDSAGNGYDTNANFDTVTNKGRFTATVAGKYAFSVAVYISTTIATNGDYIEIGFRKNGAIFSRIQIGSNGNKIGGSVTMAADISLSVTDYVDSYIDVGHSGGATLINTANLTYFCGHRIGD